MKTNQAGHPIVNGTSSNTLELLVAIIKDNELNKVRDRQLLLELISYLERIEITSNLLHIEQFVISKIKTELYPLEETHEKEQN